MKFMTGYSFIAPRFAQAAVLAAILLRMALPCPRCRGTSTRNVTHSTAVALRAAEDPIVSTISAQGKGELAALALSEK